MKIVYAMCSPRQLDFYLTDKREAVPTGATVFAICTNDRTIENQDEDLFAAISDEEYFTLRAMVRKAEKLEAKHCSSNADAQTFGQRLRNFFRRLSALWSALFSAKGAKRRGQSRRFPTCSTETIAPVRL